MRHLLTIASLGFALTCMASLPARADLKLCNNTPSPVKVAVGYKDKEGWASEGWWTIKPQACSGLLKGALIARYYYIYALDSQNGGSWGGKAMICIKDKIFTIRGLDRCVERGFQQQGFFEVDTGEKGDWTVNLSSDKPQAAASVPPAPVQPAAANTNTLAPIPDPPAKPPATETGTPTPTLTPTQGQ